MPPSSTIVITGNVTGGHLLFFNCWLSRPILADRWPDHCCRHHCRDRRHWIYLLVPLLAPISSWSLLSLPELVAFWAIFRTTTFSSSPLWSLPIPTTGWPYGIAKCQDPLEITVATDKPFYGSILATSGCHWCHHFHRHCLWPSLSSIVSSSPVSSLAIHRHLGAMSGTIVGSGSGRGSWLNGSIWLCSTHSD